MDIIAAIAEELQIKKGQAEAAVKLIDEGNTIPFIARYRKEATGSLNDEVLRNLFDRLTYLRNLEDKKQTVLASIEEQGKLTDELKKAILEAQTQVAVDDLYRPYRPKRRTRATIAKEKGLEPLAQTILAQESSVDIMAEAAKYVDAEKDVADEAAALAGAKDIIAENVSDNAGYRTKIRELTMQKGRLISTAKDPKAESVYEMYYEFDEALSKVAGHRTLAINRGEKEKILTVKIEAPTEDIIKYLKKQVITNDGALSHELLSPSKHVAKTYYARIDGEVTLDDIIRFKEGIDIGEEKPTKPAELVIKKSGSVSEIELTITEGKFHQVKRMFEALGKRVIYLKRISMGPLKLPDDLKTGTYRALTQAETDMLMQIKSGK